MENICWNCFQDRGAAQICPHCGYDPEQDREKYPHALPHGTILAGRYITGRVLGQGGFGITYIAQEYKTGNRVAIKEFFPETMSARGSSNAIIPYSGHFGQDFLYGKEAFLEEAKVLAQFNHASNVVSI